MLTESVLCLLMMFACIYYTGATLKRDEPLIAALFVSMFCMFAYLAAAFAAVSA